MYLSKHTIIKSLEDLQSVHPFFTLTFLVCKRDELPIGDVISYDINRIEKEFLESYFRPIEESEYYYRVSRVNGKKQWLKNDYPSKGSQKTRTEGIASEAFIHESGTDLWGWEKNYISILKRKFARHLPIPAFSLAVWLYRNHSWQSLDVKAVLHKFQHEFNITQEEIESLFDWSEPENNGEAFQSNPTNWFDLQEALDVTSPTDFTGKGGTLNFLSLAGIGPTQQLRIDFHERINLITGDNGLGKTFILECAWWALSGEWTGFPIVPRSDVDKNKPRISFKIATTDQRAPIIDVRYDWKKQDWPTPIDRQTVPGLVIYARVDGAFAVWDPSRTDTNISRIGGQTLIFSREQVWEGLSVKTGAGQTKYLCNGLIEDWVFWQNSQNQEVFDTLKRVLKRLSPPEQSDLGLLEPDMPIQVAGWGTKWIPTIRHPYADRIPLTQASAAIRRIAALAYLIVWAWEEHKRQSERIREIPQKKMVILIDEIESHLHPQWQRIILPALLEIQDALKVKLDVQFIITTHSPLILASLEPYYDSEIDSAFHLNLLNDSSDNKDTVTLDKPDFIFGTVDNWLRSDFFEMKHARNREAELAIEDAKKLQMQNHVSREEVAEVSDRLLKYLGAHDKFWPRWLFFAEKNGVLL